MGHNGKTLKECAEELSKAAAQARVNICELLQIEAVTAVLEGTFEQLTEKFDEAFELLRKLQASIERITPRMQYCKRPRRIYYRSKMKPYRKRTSYKPRWYWKRTRSNPRR